MKDEILKSEVITLKGDDKQGNTFGTLLKSGTELAAKGSRLADCASEGAYYALGIALGGLQVVSALIAKPEELKGHPQGGTFTEKGLTNETLCMAASLILTMCRYDTPGAVHVEWGGVTFSKAIKLYEKIMGQAPDASKFSPAFLEAGTIAEKMAGNDLPN